MIATHVALGYKTLMNDVPPEDVEAAALATARLFLAAERRWMAKENARLAAVAEAERIASEQAEDVKQVQGCYETAALFGFDLLTVVASVEARRAAPPAQLVEIAAPPPLKPPTVREYILKAAQEAWPKPVRAAPLRAAMQEKFGWQLHYKTAGMTLYRLLKEGLITRNGSDWFWNPNGAAAEDAFDPPPDFKDNDEPPDAGWLHEVHG